MRFKYSKVPFSCNFIVFFLLLSACRFCRFFCYLPASDRLDAVWMFLYSELLYIYPFSDFPVSGFPALNFPDLCRRCDIRFSSDAAESGSACQIRLSLPCDSLAVLPLPARNFQGLRYWINALCIAFSCGETGV